jgi:hypothetical protein
LTTFLSDSSSRQETLQEDSHRTHLARRRP